MIHTNDKVVVCPKCGYENISNRTYCRKCKTDMKRVARVQQEATLLENDPQRAQYVMLQGLLEKQLKEMQSIAGGVRFMVLVLIISIIVEFLSWLF